MRFSASEKIIDGTDYTQNQYENSVIPGPNESGPDYAIFQYDDNLGTGGLYAGATTLDAIYQAGIPTGAAGVDIF